MITSWPILDSRWTLSYPKKKKKKKNAVCERKYFSKQCFFIISFPIPFTPWPNKKRNMKRLNKIKRNLYLIIYFKHIYSTRLDYTESDVFSSAFSSFLFFFPLHTNSKITWFYYTGDKNTVHILFTGPKILFTHLKIILLQYFQFSVSVIISSIQTDP